MEHVAPNTWAGAAAPTPPFRKERSESELSTASSDSFSFFQHLHLASPTSPATRGASPNDAVGSSQSEVKEERDAGGSTLQESDIQGVLSLPFPRIDSMHSSHA